MASWRNGSGGVGGAAANGAPAPARSSRGGMGGRRGGMGGGRGGGAFSSSSASSSAQRAKILPNLPLPLHNMQGLQDEYYDVFSDGRLKQMHIDNPKSPLQNYVSQRSGQAPVYESQEGFVGGGRQSSVRATVYADEVHGVIGYGDAKTQKEAEKLAALDALLQLARRGLLWEKPPSKAAANGKGAMTTDARNAVPQGPTVTLSDGSLVGAERAREFMDFYCSHFRFGKPDIQLSSDSQKVGKKTITKGWQAEMRVGGHQIGNAIGANKKQATQNLYLDTIAYLESYDPDLWKTFNATHKPGTVPGNIPHVVFKLSEEVDDEVRGVYETTKQSLVFANRPRPAGHIQPGEAGPEVPDRKKRRNDTRNQHRPPTEDAMNEKSERLMRSLEDYQVDERMAKMREQRHGLPVYQKASDVLVKIELNHVSIVMAATGSGKTTQIPQILFDDYIMQGQGSKCNIICTQPRRIAAISVAERVARERGESVGKTVGYQVRFESKTPQPNGSITFCTTGVFLRRLQSALGEEDATNTFLDSLTHIVLDEVHERDLETDLLLVVLKRLLVERKRLGRKEIKLVLMSATIDPDMFCRYFADNITGMPAPVVEVPGRSFPVERHYLEETYHHLDALRLPTQQGGWVWGEKNVREYLDRELARGGGLESMSTVRRNGGGGGGEVADFIDDLELPYPLIALMISYVINKSDDGHVLVFLPGWDEIKNVNMILEDTHSRPMMGFNFTNRDKFEVHILHSSIPVAEQQAIFEPVRHQGIRRIILATNIAETSVTIPDVVYVIDTGRVKEARYDPERHLSSLVSAWVGTSNINQRAGRAGRHRPGEAYAIFSKARYDKLNVSSTVEMKRVDLSNVVMHIKALDIPGMDVEDVLQAAIEPPAPERVRAAMDKLVMVGALDANRDLTSLGRVLLQLPVDAPVGKMCLYGAFFRCLDPALTLAAVLTNRDPWMAPPNLKDEAGAIKNSWTLADFRSDPLVTLRAYSRWDDTMKRSQWEAQRFANDNFLGKITLGQIQQVKEHLFQSMEKAGILDAILGKDAVGSEGRPAGPRRGKGGAPYRIRRYDSTLPDLNSNSSSAPMLAALIALASVPNFAVRAKEHVYRTSQDKSCMIHPSSVQHAKHTKYDEDYQGEKELYAFGEKIKNSSAPGGGGGGPTMLRNVTRLDPLTYMLFGANQLRPSADGGMLCDNWLPMKGNYDALDDVERLKAILDVCMLRVFEAIQSENGPTETGNGVECGRRLQAREVTEFEALTAGVVRVLDAYSREHREATSTSRGSTRPATPLSGPHGGGSGRNTPGGGGGGGGGRYGGGGGIALRY